MRWPRARLSASLSCEPLEDRSVPAAFSAPPTPLDPNSLVVGFRTGDPADPVHTATVPTAPGQSVAAAVAAWQGRADVAYAEPNYQDHVTAIPNDPSFGQQYAQNNTGQTGGTPDADADAPEAWDLTTGRLSTVAAIIDTGVDYTHPDLYRNVWLNQAEIPAAVAGRLTDTDGDGLITFWDLNSPANIGAGKITDLNGNGYIDGGDVLKPTSTGGWADGADEGGNGYTDDLIGWNFATNTNDPMDRHGHGSHVAGTVGAVGNNGVGVAGMAWRVRLMPAPFMGADGSGTTAAAAQAVRYAADNGAVVSNNSWGGDGYSTALADAITYAGTRGHVFVAAAGNDGRNIDSAPTYPASYTMANVVTVAATDAADNLAGFSNSGSSSVDLGAGGVNILSTTGGGYGYMSGTSMATPQVTGTFALLFSRYPDLTAGEAISRVLGSVDPIPSLAGKTVTGGRLNAARAVAGPLYTDTFTTPALNPPWTAVSGGNWAAAGGVASQTSTAAGDPKKLLLTGVTTPAAVRVTARVRVDAWASGPYARAGVGVYTDPVTGRGYNLVFRDGGQVQFLDDYVAWGTSAAVAWRPGQWYWFTLEADGAGTLKGKVWADGTAEPATWTVQQTGWTTRTGGAVALHGGSSGDGYSTASFDDVTVSDRTFGVVRRPAAPAGLTATAPTSDRVQLTWAAVPGAAVYKVQRSLDGVSWVAAGTAAGSATGFSDPGRTPNTRYFYRVAAANATGDSAWSAVVQVTTPSGSSTLYSDTFDGPTLNPAWTAVSGGSWAASGGAASQTSTAAGDPKKLLLTGVSTPAAVQVTARVRVDSWVSGSYARAGLSLFNDAAGHGYNLLFRDGGQVQFLDDYVAWGNSYSFAWATGVWYRMTLRIEGGVLKGKVWADGTAEPADWMFVQTGWTTRTGGAVALHGGSSGDGYSTASFDDVAVTAV